MIYFLDENPKLAAKYLARKHLTCISIGVSSLISTCLYRKGFEVPYKPYERNKKIINWICESQDNFNWILDYGIALKEIYLKIYNKSINLKIDIESYKGIKIIEGEGLTNFPTLFPSKYISENIINSYRNYYFDKIKKSDYSGQEIPSWFNEKYLKNEKILFFDYFEEIETSLQIIKKGENIIIRKLVDGIWIDFNICKLEEKLILERVLNHD